MSVDLVDPIIGRTLGDFLVKEKLGEGGFGAVYKATQLILSREAVIKILHTRHRTNPSIIERFKREAHLASRLEHPYCAHIYSFGAESDGLLWIAMEYVAGTPLNELLKSQGTLPLERFVPLLDKICEVVHTAHEFGIVHRDLKPANVMVISRAGRLLPKLLDFGIAKGLDQSAVLVGTTLLQTNITEFTSNSLSLNCYTSTSQAKSNGSGSNGGGENTAIKGMNNNANIAVETVIDSIKPSKVLNLDSSFPSQNNRKLTVNQNITKSINTLEDDYISQLETKPKAKDRIESKPIFETPYILKTQGVIGSPAYMSPEQWENGANVDARSDIYSLGVLSYQLITGQLPFSANKFGLYSAHTNKSVPPLKTTLPAKLNTVMQKVMAKDPKDRYQTALEFAKDFREAAGFTQQEISLPQLDEILKENILTNAPKPLADAVASLLIARNTYQFRDKVLLIFRVLVRYLGLLALASHARVGINLQNNELVTKAIINLRQLGLSESEWLELSRELCRPFAKKCDTFPIPELITLFFDLGSEQLSPLTETFTKLLELQQKINSITSLKEEQLINLLADFLTKLTTFLKATTWLNDYYLVLPIGQFATKWMGIAKTISTIALKNNNLANYKAVLVDTNGYFVLSLWPLLEITPPTPGVFSEVFLLDCKGRNKAKLVSFPDGFETEEEAPWEWLKEHFLTDDEQFQTSKLLEKSPYLGLTTFSPTDSTFFFGREKETTSFLNRLRIQSLLAIIGPSGAGKSSFIQAGVIAGLPQNWQSITIRPGISPLATLSAKLYKIGIEIPDLKTVLEKDPQILAKTLRQFASEQKKILLIVVDQFEEIITLCLDKVEQTLYLETLVSLARSEEDPIRVVLTMRDDFLVRVKELKALQDRLTQGLEILTTPTSTELLKILTAPAKKAGYEFEDKKLPLEIVEAVTGQTGALPLLAFTAAKLWENRDREFKQLRRKSYEAMGGVAGALAKHAEEMLQQMPQTEQALVREAFRHLVTSDNTRAVLTRPELLQVLGNTTSAEVVVEKLITKRLLVSTEGEKGVERIEVVHEALLSAWPRLVKWRQEDTEGARLRDQLLAAARQWQERGRPKGLLWRDEALAEYQLWKERYKGKLTQVENEFATISLSEASRNQRIRRGLLITVITVLIIGSAILFYQRQQTQKQLLQTLELYEEQGRQEILRGNLEGAAVYLSEAYSKGANSLALRYMLSVALSKTENRPPINLGNHTNTVTMAAFSPNDQLAVTASLDKTVRIWQTIDGKELFILKGHQDSVMSAEFSPDGKQILSSSLDKTACIWQVSDGSLVTTLKGHTDALKAAIFSPNGKLVVTASYDSTAKIWNSTSGELITTLVGHRGSIYSACFSPDGKLVATAGVDNTAKIWNSTSGELITTLTSHQASVLSVIFSPDSKLLLTSSADGTGKLWQVADAKLLHTLYKHQGGIKEAKFSPDGKTILTVGLDKTGQLWETQTGELKFSLDGHGKSISYADFSPDGSLIVTSSQDGSVRIWEFSSGKFLVALTDHKEAVNNAVFSHSGTTILTASEDKSAKLWQLTVENRLPSEVAIIIEEKVPFYLKEGRLIAKNQTTTSEQAPKTTEIPNENKPTSNTYIEDLGNGIKIEMVKIEGGSFEMGSPSTEKGHLNNEQLHTVNLSGFYIGKYEITQAQWKAVAALPSIQKNLDIEVMSPKIDNLPANRINWDDAVEFCRRLSKATGKEYRLPTEAEWEYAARAGSKSEYPENLDEVAWYEKNSGIKVHPVGQKKPNAWGLYDIYGNLWEFCSDFYGDYPTEAVTDPKGPSSGVYRVMRGGRWDGIASHCRSAARNSDLPTTRYSSMGVRLAMTIPK